MLNKPKASKRQMMRSSRKTSRKNRKTSRKMSKKTSRKTRKSSRKATFFALSQKEAERIRQLQAHGRRMEAERKLGELRKKAELEEITSRIFNTTHRFKLPAEIEAERIAQLQAHGRRMEAEIAEGAARKREELEEMKLRPKFTPVLLEPTVDEIEAERIYQLQAHGRRLEAELAEGSMRQKAELAEFDLRPNKFRGFRPPTAEELEAERIYQLQAHGRRMEAEIKRGSRRKKAELAEFDLRPNKFRGFRGFRPPTAEELEAERIYQLQAHGRRMEAEIKRGSRRKKAELEELSNRPKSLHSFKV